MTVDATGRAGLGATGRAVEVTTFGRGAQAITSTYDGDATDQPSTSNGITVQAS